MIILFYINKSYNYNLILFINKETKTNNKMDKYEILKEIGSGAFAIVLKAKRLSDN